MLEAVIEAMSKGNAIPEGSTAEVLTPVTDVESESTQGKTCFWHFLGFFIIFNDSSFLC